MPPASLALYTCDRVRQQLHRIVVMPLILIEQRLVEKNFEAPGREILRTLQTRLRLIELSQPSIQLRQAGDDFPKFRAQALRASYIVRERRHTCPAPSGLRPARAGGPRRPDRSRLLYGTRLRLLLVLRLGIRAGPKDREHRGKENPWTPGSADRWPPATCPGQSEAGLTVRARRRYPNPLQDLPQNLFRVRMMIFETIQPRKPQRRISIVWFDLQNRLKLLDRLGDVRLWNFARARCLPMPGHKSAPAAGAHPRCPVRSSAPLAPLLWLRACARISRGSPPGVPRSQPNPDPSPRFL